MSDDDAKDGKATAVVKAVTELGKQFPIYQDAIQPAAREVGKGLHVVARAVNAALLPVEGMIWGVEKIRDFVHERVAKKLKDVPPEDIQAPKPHIGVPAIDALRYTGAEPDLADLYANLLATSMDKTTAYRAHPSFVDIIKNMSPDEARILKQLAKRANQPLINIKFIADVTKSSYRILQRHISMLGVEAGCEHLGLTTNYLDNLERLGLVEVDEMSHLTNEKLYEPVETSAEVVKLIEALNKNPQQRAECQRVRLTVTNLGNQFIRACVVDKDQQPRN